MKPFGAVVGNPPYQGGIVQDPLLIGSSPINLFHLFQQVSYNYSHKTALIYPGERWASQAGKGMTEFGRWLSGSESLQEVVYWPRSTSVFGGGVEVNGGVTVVSMDNTISNEGQWKLTEFHSGETSTGMIDSQLERSISLFPVLNYLESAVLKTVPNYVSVLARKKPLAHYGLMSSFAVKNPDKTVKCNEDFSNKPVDGGPWLRILVNDALGKGGRSTWFWAAEHEIKQTSLTDAKSWKVIMSSKNINGLNGRKPLVEILPPDTAHSTVRVTIATFDTEQECINFFRWMNTDFVRCLIAASGALLGNFASKVPDLMDYRTDGESGIDFSTVDSINDQLFSKYGLSDDLKLESKKFANTLTEFSNYKY